MSQAGSEGTEEKIPRGQEPWEPGPRGYDPDHGPHPRGESMVFLPTPRAETDSGLKSDGEAGPGGDGSPERCERPSPGWAEQRVPKWPLSY